MVQGIENLNIEGKTPITVLNYAFKNNFLRFHSKIY